MPKKPNCRRTPYELRQHETAVKVRKMTDQQLCEYITRLSASSPSVEDFFHFLDKQAGSGSGISTGTIHKLRKIAVKEGLLSNE